MRLRPLPIAASLALAFAAHAVAVRPTAQPAPPASPAPPPPPQITGSGAPYLAASAKLLAALQTAHVQAVIHTLARPTKGKEEETTSSLEIAWAPEKRFRAAANGTAGKSVIVGTGDILYIYNGMANQYVKQQPYPIEAGQELVRRQLAVLLGPGAPVWIYHGVQDVDRHPCDFITTQNFNPTQSIYLDRTTHLPRRVLVSGAGPGGSASQDTTFTLFQIDGPVPGSLFEFTPPPGSKVVVPKKQ